MLVVDGHNSHFTWDFVHSCMDNQIDIFCLPPHTTHILQPLDVGIFGPLQHHYSQAASDYLHQTDQAITKSNFLPILREARYRTYTKKNVQAAFAATGMHPVSPSVVLDRYGGTAAPNKSIAQVGFPVYA